MADRSTDEQTAWEQQIRLRRSETVATLSDSLDYLGMSVALCVKLLDHYEDLAELHSRLTAMHLSLTKVRGLVAAERNLDLLQQALMAERRKHGLDVAPDL